MRSRHEIPSARERGRAREHERGNVSRMSAQTQERELQPWSLVFCPQTHPGQAPTTLHTVLDRSRGVTARAEAAS